MPSHKDAALNPEELENVLRKLDLILDWVEEMKTRGESRHERVARLRGDEKLSKAIAKQIQTVLKAENGLQKGGDAAAVKSAWAAVTDWAQELGCRIN